MDGIPLREFLRYASVIRRARSSRGRFFQSYTL
jgi:hypothetical protein